MNDNLQRLVDKAHVYSQYETGVGFNLIDYSDKLTELILLDIRELIQDYNSSFQDGEFHARELLEHFGVTE
jgi:hypothetical protein